MIAPAEPRRSQENRFDWPLCQDAENYVLSKIEAFAQRNSFARSLAQRISERADALTMHLKTYERSRDPFAAMLADMETKCEAARGLLYKVGQMIDDDDTGPELTKLSAMAKLYCTDVAMEVTTDAVQVLGGYGYIQEYPVERMMRDAKITQIYEGTNQIQRLVIAREMLKESRAFLLAGVG